MSENRHKETPPSPNEPFDYTAVPSRFYFSAEGVGAVPVKDVVERGLDILTDNLANVIIAVNRETGAEGEDEDGAGGLGGEMVDPDMGTQTGWAIWEWDRVRMGTMRGTMARPVEGVAMAVDLG